MTRHRSPAELVAHAAYQRRRRAALRDGTWRGRVDTETVRAHVLGLSRRFGMSTEAVAFAAGVSHAAVRQIAGRTSERHPARYVLGPTAAALLAVTSPLEAPDEAKIFAVGTRRRIEALMLLGWPKSVIGERLGVTKQAVGFYLRAPRITARNARAVAAVYDELVDWPGESPRTARWAAAHGFAAPWAWLDANLDPIDIDDATARPYRRRRSAPAPAAADPIVDEVAVQRAISGTRPVDLAPVELTPDERLEVVRALAARGMPDTEIAERCGVTDRTIERDRSTHGIESRWSA